MLKRRVTTMYEKACLFLAIVLYVAVISESWVIVPRLETEVCGPNEEYSDCINPCNDCQTRNIPCNFLVCNRGCDCKPGYTRNLRRMCIPENQCPPGKRSVLPIDYNYEPNNELDFENEAGTDDNLPGANPERFPSGEELDETPQENPKENDVIDKIGDDVLEESEEDKKDKEYEPEEEKLDEEKLEEEENEEKPNEEKEEEEELDEEKLDEEKKEEEKENEEKPDEEIEEDKEKPDEEKEEELDEEKPDEEKKEEENEEKLDEKKKEEEPIDDDNEEEKIPKEVDEETDENDFKNKDGIPQEGNAGFFEGGSIFDTPFFNLQKVKNYFNKINRALGHVFQQTVDEALLMNGTFSNTTEEEVDIDGKKYIITKSVIKGGDNQSSLYIESLSAKPKMNDTEEMKDIEIKNVTQA